VLEKAGWVSSAFVGCEVATIPPLREPFEAQGKPAHKKLWARESRVASVGMTNAIKSFLQGLKPSSRGVVTWGLKPPPPKEKSRSPLPFEAQGEQKAGATETNSTETNRGSR